jgi:hypothetical protein
MDRLSLTCPDVSALTRGKACREERARPGWLAGETRGVPGETRGLLTARLWRRG